MQPHRLAWPTAIAAAACCFVWAPHASSTSTREPQLPLPSGWSLFHLVQGYPLEADVANGANTLVSWPPSAQLDEQTGFSQGSDGVVLTTGPAGQTVAWSLWGDGQSTVNHRWRWLRGIAGVPASSVPALFLPQL